jgi:hypothetical protein
LTRTAPRTPCAPVTTPTQTRRNSLSPGGAEGWGEGAGNRLAAGTLTRLALSGEPPSPALRERVPAYARISWRWKAM